MTRFIGRLLTLLYLAAFMIPGLDIPLLDLAYAGAALPECADGIDNDDDQLTDYPFDPECDAATDPSEGTASDASTLAARWLLAVATSGSLNKDFCGAFTGGDGSSECPGDDVSCASCSSSRCGNAIADDSRLMAVKLGMSRPVKVRDQSVAQFALMRAHQAAVPLSCPTADAASPSGGWQGAPTTECDGAYNSGDLLVRFSGDGASDVLAYINSESDAGMPPADGADFELRASGERPLAGILASAKDALLAAQAADPVGEGRPYGVILLSDGGSTCPGDTAAAAADLMAQGFPTWVIGIETGIAEDINELNAIAFAGGTGLAVFVDEAIGICAVLSQILDDGITCDTVFYNGYE